MMPSVNPPAPTPTPDELEDLIYFSRTNDVSSLRDLVASLCTSHACPPSIILASAIDVDADGLGSQSCLLHYPAANGNLDTVQYLLEMLTPSATAGEHAAIADKSAPELVNHRNVSGNTPLHWAAMNGHLDVVKGLVGAGADARIQNEAGRDAVVEAEMSSKEDAIACVEWMLKNCEGLDSGVGGSLDQEDDADTDIMKETDGADDENGTTTNETTTNGTHP